MEGRQDQIASRFPISRTFKVLHSLVHHKKEKYYDRTITIQYTATTQRYRLFHENVDHCEGFVMSSYLAV